MGITYVDAEARGPSGIRRPVRLLVDSWSSYSVLPEQVWKAIELTPQREMSFTLADGTQVVRQVSECHLTLEHGQGHTPVILGEPGDEGLLGVVTLEILGLVLNPFNRTLQPMRAMLMSARTSTYA